MWMVMSNNELLICFRIALSAVNMELTDYDIRTALHVSSSEGNKAEKCVLCISTTIKKFRVS